MSKRKTVEERKLTQTMQYHVLFIHGVQANWVSYLQHHTDLAHLRLVCQRWSSLWFPCLQVIIKESVPMKQASPFIATAQDQLILEKAANHKSTQKLLQLAYKAKHVKHLIIVDHTSGPKKWKLNLSHSECQVLTLHGCHYNQIWYPPNLHTLHYDCPWDLRYQPHYLSNLQHLIVKIKTFLFIRNSLKQCYPSLQTITIQFACLSWEELSLLDYCFEGFKLPLHLTVVCEFWDSTFSTLKKSEWFIVTENGLGPHSPNSVKAASPISL